MYDLLRAKRCLPPSAFRYTDRRLHLKKGGNFIGIKIVAIEA